MLRLFLVGALLALVLGEAPREGWSYEGRDCRPSSCGLDDGALELCAPPGQAKRLHLEQMEPPRPTSVRFHWHPGSLHEAKELQLLFRYDLAEQHRVTLDVGQGVITTSHGLPEASVPFPFEARVYAVEVVHGHRLKVYVDGTEPSDLVLDVPLEPDQQDATLVVARVEDDGRCHRFPDLGGTQYTWDCRQGRCILDDEGIELCGTTRLRWEPPVRDGTVIFGWDPGTFGVHDLTVLFRADAASGRRHAVSFDFLRAESITFDEGLNGMPVPLMLAAGENQVRLRHGANGLGLGEVHVYLNDLATPYASATYTEPTESATAFEFVAQNSFTGCQWITAFAPPAAN